MQSSKSFEEVTKARKQLDEKIENIKNRMQQHKVHQAANEKVQAKNEIESSKYMQACNYLEKQT